MYKGDIVIINGDYMESQGMPANEPGLVLRSQYEKQIQLTEKITACELMIDVLVGGKVFPAVPVKYCKRMKK